MTISLSALHLCDRLFWLNWWCKLYNTWIEMFATLCTNVSWLDRSDCVGVTVTTIVCTTLNWKATMLWRSVPSTDACARTFFVFLGVQTLWPWWVIIFRPVIGRNKTICNWSQRLYEVVVTGAIMCRNYFMWDTCVSPQLYVQPVFRMVILCVFWCSREGWSIWLRHNYVPATLWEWGYSCQWDSGRRRWRRKCGCRHQIQLWCKGAYVLWSQVYQHTGSSGCVKTVPRIWAGVCQWHSARSHI